MIERLTKDPMNAHRADALRQKLGQGNLTGHDVTSWELAALLDCYYQRDALLAACKAMRQAMVEDPNIYEFDMGELAYKWAGLVRIADKAIALDEGRKP